MKRSLSVLLILLLLSTVSLAFAAYDDYGIYRVNEQARVLQLYADGMSIMWQWSKGVTWTGEDPPNMADWADIPSSSGVLFDYESAGDSDYLHLKKTYYTEDYGGNFHFRYQGDDPIGDHVMYKNVCHFKFSKNIGLPCVEIFFQSDWKIFQAERCIYMLTEVEDGIWEYVYMATEPVSWPYNELEPPYGFGTLE